MILSTLVNKGEGAHNRSMANLLEKFRAWRRRHEKDPADGEASKDDWKTVGKTFRATDAAAHYNLPMSPKDEGRPPH